ncbi:aspartate/glutamate racemase family protein [Tissierellaceae bacterium HCP3S3_D8]
MGKVLGILGGMGPLATVKLFEDIVLLTEANSDQEHIHTIVDSNTSIADRTDYILDNSLESPIPELIKSALRLERAGADFIIMPCNTAHNFYDEIVKNIDIPLLNMIEESVKYIIEKFDNITKVGLLATEGTIKAGIYDNVYHRFGIEIVKPSPENQRYITELIYNIKEGIYQENLQGFYGAMDELRESGVDVFVAGCTEISVAIELFNLKGNIINPMKILAIEAIKFAGKTPKKQ